MDNGLRKRAVSGVVWVAFEKYSTMFIQFVSGIVLARLLTPYDYGCIGMLAIFMALAETFIDGGFGSALIQKKRPTQEDYSTIFWWNIVMALVLYGLLFFCAPFIARFYKIPLLSKVLRIQGAVLFIYAFNIVQRNQLRKNLNFRVISKVSIVTSLLSLSITIYLAYKGFGVWALVAQNFLTSLIPAFIFWFYVKWRPLFAFSWDSFKSLFSFGLYMFLTHIVNRFSQHIQGLLIGKIYNPSTLGYYSKASSTENLASTSISQVMTQVTYPLYAEVQDDTAKLREIIKKLTSLIAFISFPMLLLLLLIAKPLFVLLYSEAWLQSVPYFQVLCLAGMAVCLQSVNLQAISAIGKSNITFTWTLIKQAIGLIVIVGGLFLFGMTGLLAGAVLSAWVSYLINILLVSKYIGYRWTTQILDLLPIFIASCFSTVLAYFVSSLIGGEMYLNGLFKVLVFSVIYVGWAFLFKPAPLRFFMEITREHLQKRSRGK